jgi:hypothetical protein
MARRKRWHRSTAADAIDKAVAANTGIIIAVTEPK